MLEVKLKKRFPSTPTSPGFELDLAFQAAPGINVLFGPSGSGKSLTLDLIAGFAQPTEGRILLNDRLLVDAATQVSLAPQQRNCGYVFQRHALFPHLSLRENLFLTLAHRPKLERHRRTALLLEAFHLESLAHRLPSELSGGQRQRASIARALLTQPAALLLDEPSNGLDTVLRHELYAILDQVRADFPIPILLVTHDLDEAFTLAQHMFVLLEGRLAQSASPREILSRPASPAVAQALGLFNLLPAEIKFLDPGQNKSRLLWNGVELEGPYYPGHFLGNQVTLCVRRDEIALRPSSGKPAKGQLVLPVEASAELSQSALLRFPGDLFIEVPLPFFAENRHHRDWLIEFAPSSLRVL
jgi:molybdate transport system ATP-binding protein